MSYCNKHDTAEKEIITMKKVIKSEKFEESYIRKLVSMQKGGLSILSKYYDGNIAEGNWSLIENDLDIENLDKEIIDDKSVDAIDIMLGLAEYPRVKDAEYSYVFIPSYYAVKILILYYLEDKKQAKRIYALRNAVVRRNGEKFYGGLPFILKYMKKLPKDDSIKFDFADIMEALLDYKNGLEINNTKDDFINDINDCIEKSCCKTFIIEKRIKDFKDEKDKYFCVNIGDLLHFTPVDNYQILGHRDIKKDFKYLQKEQKEKAMEKISKTPNHPNNDFPEDSEALKGNLKGWFSQRISKKDRLVYKKDSDKKIIYIATVCGHYDEAPNRTKSTSSYRLITDY